MSYSLLERIKLEDRARRDAAKWMQQLEKKVADISKVKQLKKDILLSRHEIETMKKANFDTEREALKAHAKKAEAELVGNAKKLQSLEAKVLSQRTNSILVVLAHMGLDCLSRLVVNVVGS